MHKKRSFEGKSPATIEFIRAGATWSVALLTPIIVVTCVLWLASMILQWRSLTEKFDPVFSTVTACAMAWFLACGLACLALARIPRNTKPDPGAPVALTDGSVSCFQDWKYTPGFFSLLAGIILAVFALDRINHSMDDSFRKMRHQQICEMDLEPLFDFYGMRTPGLMDAKSTDEIRSMTSAFTAWLPGKPYDVFVLTNDGRQLRKLESHGATHSPVSAGQFIEGVDLGEFTGGKSDCTLVRDGRKWRTLRPIAGKEKMAFLLGVEIVRNGY